MAYTFEKQEEYALIAKGDYEVEVEKVEIKTMQNSGKQCISLSLRIRDDIEQKSGGRYVFESIWQERDNPQYFNRKRINSFLGTQDIKEGQSFDTIEDVLAIMDKAQLIAHINIVHDDYNDKDVNKVVYFKTSQHKAKPLFDDGGEDLDISSDDLPF